MSLSTTAFLAAGLTLVGCGEPVFDVDAAPANVGEAFVRERGCPRCHQSDFPVDGVLSGRSTPVIDSLAFGSNLTPDHATGLGDWADLAIVRAMRFGVDAELEPLCDAMPRYPNMTDLEAGAIVAYLRSLPAITRADGGIPPSQCPPVKPPLPLDLALSDDFATPEDLSLSVEFSAPVDGGAIDGGSSGG